MIAIAAILAGAVLVWLLLNAALGWWWADPPAGLVIVCHAVREGFAAMRGEEACSDPGGCPAAARGAPRTASGLSRQSGKGREEEGAVHRDAVRVVGQDAEGVGAVPVAGGMPDGHRHGEHGGGG